jgi:hypothetical protein
VIIHFIPAILFFSLRALIHAFERRSLKIIHGADLKDVKKDNRAF